MKYKIGLAAEHTVSAAYELKFYTILKHRYKTKLGEIDLICCKDQQIVFVEVKARKQGIHEHIISDQQIIRIQQTAELFIATYSEYHNYDLRFDLAVVTPHTTPFIIENAW